MSAKSLELSVIFFLLSGTLSPSLVGEAMCFQNPGNAIEMAASMWNYKTICEFSPPPHSIPQTIIQKPGAHTFSISGCKNLERKYGHPPAVRIELKNTVPKKSEVAFEGLGSVVLFTSDGIKLHPIAILMKEGFFDVFVGDTFFSLDPDEQLSLLFLFERAKTGDAIRFGSIKLVTIR
jgi:hypothetical protein